MILANSRVYPACFLGRCFSSSLAHDSRLPLAGYQHTFRLRGVVENRVYDAAVGAVGAAV